jgi:hypothetical protein
MLTGDVTVRRPEANAQPLRLFIATSFAPRSRSELFGSVNSTKFASGFVVFIVNEDLGILKKPMITSVVASLASNPVPMIRMTVFFAALVTAVPDPLAKLNTVKVS